MRWSKELYKIHFHTNHENEIMYFFQIIYLLNARNRKWNIYMQTNL